MILIFGNYDTKGGMGVFDQGIKTIYHSKCIAFKEEVIGISFFAYGFLR
jgi:hypothetical protein